MKKLSCICLAIAALAACSREGSQAPKAAPAPEVPAATATPTPPAESAAPADENSPVSYSSELEFVDDKFVIEVHGNGPGSLLVVSAQRAGKPLGDPVQARLDGIVRNAAAIDLDGDQQAELVIFGGSKGFIGWTFAGGKFARIELPQLTPEQAAGRKAEDEYALEGRVVVRKMPLESGGTRQIRYKLSGGQGFVVDSVTEA